MPIFLVVAIIMICIYGGVGTPTEAGSLGAFIILLMALFKGMRWHELRSSLMETAKLTVMIFTIIWGVLLYVRFLGFADLPGAFASMDYQPRSKSNANVDSNPACLRRTRYVYGCNWNAVY